MADISKYNAEKVNLPNGSFRYSFSPMSEGVKYFFDNYGKDLLRAIQGSGIFLATAAGQKMIESGFGTSDLARNFNNFGGIKYGSGLTGATGSHNGYAIFATPYDCFQTYINHVLKDPTKRYLTNGLLQAATPKDQLLVIAKSGYCENPPNPNIYAKPINKLIDLVTNMYQFGTVK